VGHAALRSPIVDARRHRQLVKWSDMGANDVHGQRSRFRTNVLVFGSYCTLSMLRIGHFATNASGAGRRTSSRASVAHRSEDGTMAPPFSGREVF
jgi:hypothetical protein